MEPVALEISDIIPSSDFTITHHRPSSREGIDQSWETEELKMNKNEGIPQFGQWFCQNSNIGQVNIMIIIEKNGMMRQKSSTQNGSRSIITIVNQIRHYLKTSCKLWILKILILVSNEAEITWSMSEFFKSWVIIRLWAWVVCKQRNVSS